MTKRAVASSRLISSPYCTASPPPTVVAPLSSACTQIRILTKPHMFRELSRSPFTYLSLTSSFILVFIPLLCSYGSSSLYRPTHSSFSIVGFQDKLKVVDGNPRVCPKCHNGKDHVPFPAARFPLTLAMILTVCSYLPPLVTVVRASARMWFSFFLVRVIPMRKKQIWICSTCNWNVPVQNGYVIST